MAGDENEARREASDHAEPPAGPSRHSPGIATPFTNPAMTDQAATDHVATDHGATDKGATDHGASASAASEWTVSDVRGPLNAAGSARPIDAVPDDRTPYETHADAPPSGDPAAVAPVSQVEPRPRGSLWPVAAGIVVGAVIGAGSAYVVYGASAPAASGDATAALDQKLAALSGRVDSLAARPTAAPQSGGTPQADLAPLKGALADLTARVAAAESAAKAAAAKADAATAAGGSGASVDNAAVSALGAKLGTLDAAVGSLKQQAVSPADLKAAQDGLASLQATVATLQTQGSDNARQDAELRKHVAGADADIQTLRAGQARLEAKVAAPGLAVVADSLVTRITRGLPFVTQVNALDSLGVDPARIAVLRQSAEQGVPSAKALADGFEPLTSGLLAGETKLKPNASFWDRMKAGAGGLVSIQRVDDAGGDDVGSRVARIKADLQHDDVVAALAVWNQLPADLRARPAAAAWGALAKTHAEAIVAADAISHEAVASLGAKKS